ncbi:heterokaryon incompatibility protein-domain-containing protein [Stachybotrys elegans]|uniref:Heterokaryon incompatibility protein-domain-containing protein n=1 Tax=Stachybotrys elegans TaxID=80388 RepID=A0A8K0WML6_9HYPO|nr:heterokaryon incompatibility protein-domain-containing protein [Stachybotrys elegans]
MTGQTAYYTHQPLPTPRSIRVLRLEPSPHRTAELRCRLVAVSLDESPKFWALSYTWDAESPSYPVVCIDGSSDLRLDITPNCAAALRHLRDATEERTLWVDGICINQLSVEERSSQVGLMGEIYLGAEKVVVWLGEGDQAAAESINLLQQIGDVSKIKDLSPIKGEIPDHSDTTQYLASRQITQKKLHDQAREIVKNVKHQADDRINAIFRRNWFRRMWTVQEVILPSATKIEVRCGDSCIRWITFWTATDILGAIDYPWIDTNGDMKLLRYGGQMILRHRFPDAGEIMAKTPGLDIGMNLSLFLLFCRPKLATDPKDKVYALYGLLRYFKIPVPEANYDKPVEEIYTEVTAASIQHDKDLYLLNFVPSDSRRLSLPSWVPDWSDKGFEEGDARHAVVRDRFIASAGSAARWRFTSNPREIVIHGKVIDTVIYRANSFGRTVPPDIPSLLQRDASGRIIVSDALRKLHVMYNTMKEWVEVAYWAESYPTGESIDSALKTTLLGDFPENNGSPEAQQFGDWLVSMRATESQLTAKAMPLAVSIGAAPLPEIRLRSVFSSIFRSNSRRGLIEQLQRQVEGIPIELRTMLAMMSDGGGWGYHSNAQSFSTTKAFFRTEGGYFGLAPDRFPGSMQTGDVVALVAGLPMPVLLRRVDSSYRLVSHCYVHGMMYGDVWDQISHQAGDISLI